MDGYLKQSTAATVMIGPFLDSTDGVTAETGLTISQADVRLSKNGAAFGQKSDTGAAAHAENGYYTCALNTTDTNTAGILKLAVAESGALPVWHTWSVLVANVYDALIGGTDALQVHANEITAGLITAAAIDTGAIDADAIAADAITSAKIAADAISAAALSAAAVDEILDEVVEGSLTLRQILRILLGASAGKSAGGGTATITFRDNADTLNRISATVDANNNRTAVTLNVS